MTYDYDMAVFIGRFEPFHIGHMAVIRTALERANKVAIIIGSTGAPRNHRNPFTYDERVGMILDAFPEDKHRIFTAPMEDTLYNDDKWLRDVQEAVNILGQKAYGAWHPRSKVALIGHGKDNSSFYLKLFPQWDSINVDDITGVSATAIRDWYFCRDSDYFLRCSEELDHSTKRFLGDFSRTDAYKAICDEYDFVAKYKKAWAAAPYAPTFVTTDAVVVQSGHVLLVQRGAMPGKGLWALPGGFLEQSERIVDGMLRELKEETKIKVPVPVLRGSIVDSRVFDDPHRSSRGRTITHAFLISLPPDSALPKVKGSDDAQHAKWIPRAEITRGMMFEDHFDIVNAMVDLLSKKDK